MTLDQIEKLLDLLGGDVFSDATECEAAVKEIRQLAQDIEDEPNLIRVSLMPYVGEEGRDYDETPENARELCIEILDSAAVRVHFGEPSSERTANFHIERQPERWSVYLHPDAGDPIMDLTIPDFGEVKATDVSLFVGEGPALVWQPDARGAEVVNG